MAQARIKATVEVVLVLTEEEADFIKALVQNPTTDLGVEPPSEKRLREAIFKALQHAG